MKEEEIKFLGKTPREIAERYFNKSYEGKERYDILVEGFIEGFNYLFPHYYIANTLAETLERFRELENKEKKRFIIIFLIEIKYVSLYCK